LQQKKEEEHFQLYYPINGPWLTAVA